MADKPTITTSRYAIKVKLPIEATHQRHHPPVSWCRLCRKKGGSK